MARRAVTALADGARTIMILGGEPTIHLADALEFVACLPDTARVVWKTNAHASAQARELMEGMFDVVLADYKFGNDACAQRLARVPDYNKITRENLAWAVWQGELIVRHLLMPGHLECCWRVVAEWMAANLPGVKVNLRAGFWPAWRAGRHAELSKPSPVAEQERAMGLARELNLNLIP
jgi:putative pyruvate formate lyase activating enzyme